MGTKIIRDSGVECTYCHSPMDIMQLPKYEGKWPWWLIGAGGLLSLMGGIVVGVFMLAGGVYAMNAHETVSCCPKCGYYFKVRLTDRTR